MYCQQASIEKIPTNQWSYLLVVFNSNHGFKLHFLLVGLSDGLTIMCTNCHRPEGQNVLHQLMNSTYKQAQVVLACIYHSKVKKKKKKNNNTSLTYPNHLGYRQAAALGAHYNWACCIVAGGNVAVTVTWLLISADALLCKLEYCMHARILGALWLHANQDIGCTLT